MMKQHNNFIPKHCGVAEVYKALRSNEQIISPKMFFYIYIKAIHKITYFPKQFLHKKSFKTEPSFFLYYKQVLFSF